MDRIQVGNLSFKCASAGKTGPLVVLLHGYGGGPLDWHHAIAHLEPTHRLLVPNLTPLFSSVQPLTFSKQVEIVASIINQINSKREKFILVGSSYGGTLTWALRAHFQSLVTGHVLLNPMPLDPLSTLRSAQLRMLFGLNMVPGALPLFLKSHIGRNLLQEVGAIFGFVDSGRGSIGAPSERKFNLIAKAVQRFAWICQHEQWSSWADQLRDHVIPLMLVTGTEDKLFNERDFRSYQNLVPMSEHHVIQGGDHVMIRSKAAELSRLISAFTASLDKEGEVLVETLRHAI